MQSKSIKLKKEQIHLSFICLLIRVTWDLASTLSSHRGQAGLMKLSAAFKDDERSRCEWTLLLLNPLPLADSAVTLLIMYSSHSTLYSSFCGADF